MKREKGWYNLTFGLEARLGLGLAFETPNDEMAKRYGPLGAAFLTVGEHPPFMNLDPKCYDPLTDRFNEQVWHWGAQTDLLLRDALRRLRPWNRGVEAFEHWLADEYRRIPMVAKAILWMATYALGLLTGWLIPK